MNSRPEFEQAASSLSSLHRPRNPIQSNPIQSSPPLTRPSPLSTTILPSSSTLPRTHPPLPLPPLPPLPSNHGPRPAPVHALAARARLLPRLLTLAFPLHGSLHGRRRWRCHGHERERQHSHAAVDAMECSGSGRNRGAARGARAPAAAAADAATESARHAERMNRRGVLIVLCWLAGSFSVWLYAYGPRDEWN
ncbi:hypothetical protein BKA80DRAFT_136899 [Phyllosticta citrichinensis]